jgi:hypothetical protein
MSNDFDIPLNENVISKGVNKMLYLPHSSKVLGWYSKKPTEPFVIIIDLKNMENTHDNFFEIVDGELDSDTKENLYTLMSDAVIEYEKENSKDEDKNKKTKIQIAFESVRQQARNLFIDEYQIPHIAIPVQDHLEILPVNSNSFKNWYRMFIFERDGLVLDNQTIHDLCSLASAYAASSKYGAQINLNLRTALNIYFKPQWNYDLVNDSWEFIKITSNGWDIYKDEIIFRRYNNQRAQVYPDRNYQPDIIDQFMKLVNIKADDNDSKLLLKCYIISLFIPEIQKVVLILHGSQGAAKSSLQELIKMLVDPSIVKTLTFPRDLNELIQQLSHNYVTYYDNVSIIKPWISDQLCRAVSGSGSSKRQLYSDDDDIIRSFKRCIGINGINLAANKPDLLDRSIIIKLERIEDNNQRTPQEIWKTFEEIRAPLLGYILDILVKVLEYEENVPNQKFKLSRMTEFTKYGEIISRCMGNKDNEFLEAYKRNREIQTDEIIESSQIATILMYMMFQKYGNNDIWEGTPTALYGEIKNIVDTDANKETPELNINTYDKYYPKSVKSFGRRLNEIIPTLKDKGLEIYRYEESDTLRTKKIIIRKVSPETPETPESDKSRSNLDNFSGDTSGDIKDISGDIEKVSPENNDLNRAQNKTSGDMGDMDDIIRGSIGDVSEFIKIKGNQIGDGIVFNPDPASGSLLLQNNFLTGHLRMRGRGGGAYPYNYLEFIDRIFGPESNTIEVCSGTVNNCFTVDINREKNPSLCTDGQELRGIVDNTFSRWRSDPPYNEKTAKEMYNCELPSLSKLLEAGARVVKPGSLMFLLCNQNRQICPNNLKRIGFIYISVVPNNETRILNIYVKLPENQEISK